MIKIVVDAFGGDNAPEEIVKGCILALDDNENVHIVLSGKKDLIEAELDKYKYDIERIS
jgi:glycerol-3-phosphate acyltransferase PlsX